MKSTKYIFAVMAMILFACTPVMIGTGTFTASAQAAPPAAVQERKTARKIAKPRMQDVLARSDAKDVLDANGRIKSAGPHVQVKPKYYVRQANNTIVELDADTGQPQDIAVGAAGPVTWFTPTLPSDFGPTIDVSSKPLWSQPFEEKEVWQGNNGTCYQLVIYQSALREKPSWLFSKDVMMRRPDGTVQIIYRRDPLKPIGVLLDNRVSAMDSRLNPKTGACAIALLERGYDFFRTFNPTTKVSTNTRASTSFGWMGSVMTDFGIKNLAIYPAQANSQTALMAALASDQLVTACTKPSPTSGLTIGAHAYSILNITVESGQTLVWLRNPWGIDGAGNDGNTEDGIIKETWAQFAGDMSATCVSTEYPKDVELAIVNTDPPLPLVIPGDANADGRVDFADFTILSNNYGKATTKGRTDGDFNADGTVTFADYVILSNNYGKGTTDVGASDVPAAPGPLFTVTDPAPGSDPDNITVTGAPLTPIRLAFTTDADSVVSVAPGSNPQILLSKPATSYNGWISTIGTKAVTVTYTATRGADGAKVVKTITLAPNTTPPETQPAPVTKKASIILYEDHTWADAPK